MRPASARLSLATAMLAALLAPALPAAAQASAPPGLAIEGRVEHPRTFSLAEFRALPPVTLEVEHANGNGMQRNTFTGALLWPLITEAHPVTSRAATAAFGMS